MISDLPICEGGQCAPAGFTVFIGGEVLLCTETALVLAASWSCCVPSKMYLMSSLLLAVEVADHNAGASEEVSSRFRPMKRQVCLTSGKSGS